MSDLGIPVSVVIQTKNEERNIGDCIDTFSNFNQVIVIDSLSTDGTKGITLSHHAEYLEFKWNGSYPKKKQWILDNCELSFDWVLFIDADERMTQTLAHEISQFMRSENAEFGACMITLEYYLAGRKLNHGHKFRKICLINRRVSYYPVIDDLDAPGMGELEGHYQPKFQGKLFQLKQKLVHNDNDDVSSWIDRQFKYSKWDAYVKSNSDLSSKIGKLKTPYSHIFHRLPFRSQLFFFYSYFFRLGFLDGIRGYVFARCLATSFWIADTIQRFDHEKWN